MSRTGRRASGVAVLLALCTPARAETLAEALSLAYRSNPALLEQRATQRGIDETTVQARAGWRPTVSVSVDTGYLDFPSSGDYVDGSLSYNQAEATLNVTQPLYTGGRVRNAVLAADARMLAGRQGLRLKEAQTFRIVIGAYMDVLRDTDIVAVRQADLATLQRQVRETRSRYTLGAGVTGTDVAQAEAQRDDAAAALASAQAGVAASRASYRAAVGAPPGTLVQPDALPGLAGSLQDAATLAAAGNPALAQSMRLADASSADIGTARSGYFPTVGLTAEVGGIGAAVPFRGRRIDRETSGLLTLTQPLAAGGLVNSQVRQARDRHEADRQAAEAAARQADQDVTTAWTAGQAGLASIRFDTHQVEAATMALKGYQLEYADGLRSTLDVLIADQTLRAAQVSLAVSRHDTIVAEAAVLATTGRLEARWLLAGEAAYDPRAAYDRIRNKGAVPWEGAVALLDHGG